MKRHSKYCLLGMTLNLTWILTGCQNPDLGNLSRARVNAPTSNLPGSIAARPGMTQMPGGHLSATFLPSSNVSGTQVASLGPLNGAPPSPTPSSLSTTQSSSGKSGSKASRKTTKSKNSIEKKADRVLKRLESLEIRIQAMIAAKRGSSSDRRAAIKKMEGELDRLEMDIDRLAKSPKADAQSVALYRKKIARKLRRDLKRAYVQLA